MEAYKRYRKETTSSTGGGGSPTQRNNTHSILELYQRFINTPKFKMASCVSLLKEYLHFKLWRVSGEQQQKWLALTLSLSQLYGIENPRIIIDANCKIPNYNRATKTITLQKYSVISLLHEFGHHLGFNEWECVNFSEIAFSLAYKPANKLSRDKRGYLVKK
jgi:hypothetical protein